MSYLDIIIPVKNEVRNIDELVNRINNSLLDKNIDYRMIFVDDHSTDKTVELLNLLKKNYPIRIYIKQGKPGKAYSILEGVAKSAAEYVVMIDADLQYPPEAIPEMLELTKKHGVVVARRAKYKDSKVRKLFSHSFNTLFGKVLHGFKCDVQSGLKLFKREIALFVDPQKITPWTLDLTLLHTAQDLGYSIGEVNIKFSKRANGKSKVNLLSTTLEIGKQALKLKLQRQRTFVIPPTVKMEGAGIAHKGARFTTHTTLPIYKSAFQTFLNWQVAFAALLLEIILFGILINPLATVITIVGILSGIYFIDVLFNLFVVLKSLKNPPEMTFSEEEIASLDESSLPIYTILCPLYKEANVIPSFIDSISKLSWPKNKLDVILLLEEDDKQSIESVKKLNLPSYVRAIIVPDSNPKTKPKACNYGLNFAKGECLVIYDAEDQPDPLQLKKAYIGFLKSNSDTACLQAKLNYFNPHQNLLTRLFTAEYSLWFDVILTGLQSIGTTIPLGGTSNHFKTKILRDMQGWDPFNVTEDCDLGVRLYTLGYKTAVIDSVTEEEANSNVKNWIRQRSRWIKGYMQTYLVHMRSPLQLIRNHGIHAFIFQLIIGARISFLLINPILWAVTFSYFAFYNQVGPAIESIYPSIVFYMAAFSLIFGNFTYLYNYMIGLARREKWDLIKFIYIIPFYWLLASIAAMVAFYQLLVKPHYWEKTNHGLNLEKLPEVKQAIKPTKLTTGFWGNLGSLVSFRENKRLYLGGLTLVTSSLIANFLSFVLNTYLGRRLSFEDLGLFSLFSGFLVIIFLPLDSFSTLVAYKTAYLVGKYSKLQAKGYVKYIGSYKFLFSGIATLIWLLASPFLSEVFKSNLLSFLIFAPILGLGIFSSILQGYLKGTLSFGKYAGFILVESISRLIIAACLISFGYSYLVIGAIPLAYFLALTFSSLLIFRDKSMSLPKEEKTFDWHFYSITAMSKLSSISYLSLDLILVKLFLSPVEAGRYALLALTGKMIYFLGSLFTTFMIPIVSKNEGANKNSKKAFMFLFGITVLISVSSVIALGGLGYILVPFLFGNKAYSIIEYLPVYALAIGFLTVSQPIVLYNQAKKNYSYSIVSFLISLLQIVLLSIYHRDLKQVSFVMLEISIINMLAMILIYLSRDFFKAISANLNDFYELISLRFKPNNSTTAKRILILNWRDTKHSWAGGAETYIFEIAKRWVKKGDEVTIFCGNDNENPRYEVLNGVKIVRRGGFYTVYIWAFLYYVLKFRNRFDVIIDSANGVPFFTPLYVSKPKILLIHHVHQEVFRNYLSFPLSEIAAFVESKLMPLAYRKQSVVTVSESSKKEIYKSLNLGKLGSISVVNPGNEVSFLPKNDKTLYPSFLYLGRIKPYKNIDVIIKAFKAISNEFPDARLNIAGSGEAAGVLTKLTKDLGLENSVNFLGRVSDNRKAELFSTNWVMLQPSAIEGWGITVIEANSYRTPVIASDVSGLRDSIVNGQTGLLVRPNDIELFALAMRTLITENSYRLTLSQNAFEWSKNFDWNKSADKFYELVDLKIAEAKYRKAFNRATLVEGN